jgi:hypothetical protein
VKAQLLGFALDLLRNGHGFAYRAGLDCGQSKYTVNFAVHCRASHFPQVPVIRVFQSVNFLSNWQVSPDFSISVQWVFVTELVATLQAGGIGTSQCLPLELFLIAPI